MASDPILAVSGVSLRKGQAILLDNVSFVLQPGRFYGLLGPNGAGKSSLLKILYRAEKPSSGRVHLSGQDLDSIPRRLYASRVGALVQEAVSLSGLSLLEVVRLGLLPRRLDPHEIDSRSRAALEDVGLSHRADDDANHLSGGEQQRLFFAQILALAPDLYLLDEPHNHLDLHFQYRLLDLVRQRGATVLASFHDMGLAARYCDEVLLVDQGRIVGQGPIESVLSRERLASTYRVDGAFIDGRLEVRGAV